MDAGEGLNFRPVRMGAMRAAFEQRDDGTFYVRSLETLGEYPRSMTDRLEEWARRTPDAVFIADRGGPGGAWRTISYAEAWQAVRSLGQAILDAGLSAGTSARHPVGERDRACADGLCGDAGRRSACAAVAGLFAGFEGLRQAAAYRRAARAGHGLCQRRRAVRGGARRRDRSCRPSRRPRQSARRAAGQTVRRAGGDRPRHGRRRGQCRGHARHHRQVPVHLGLDRDAQGASSPRSACSPATRR